MTTYRYLQLNALLWTHHMSYGHAKNILSPVAADQKLPIEMLCQSAYLVSFEPHQ